MSRRGCEDERWPSWEGVRECIRLLMLLDRNAADI